MQTKNQLRHEYLPNAAEVTGALVIFGPLDVCDEPVRRQEFDYLLPSLLDKRLEWRGRSAKAMSSLVSKSGPPCNRSTKQLWCPSTFGGLRELVFPPLASEFPKP